MSETSSTTANAGPNPTAEERKELGNEAFASKEYDKAIAYYTEAITIDPSNHIYYSNRSASHGGKLDWTAAAADAKKCISLNPSFLKGYYRLATAQIELGLYDEALVTIKQGMTLDAHNSLLMKQLRITTARRAQSTSPVVAPVADAAAAPPSTGGTAEKELLDLQEQFIATTREYHSVKAMIVRSQREQKMNLLTQTELEQLPLDGIKLYRGIGKMFMLSSKSDVLDNLQQSMKMSGKKEADMSQKLVYLESRLQNQRQNILELTKHGSNASLLQNIPSTAALI